MIIGNRPVDDDLHDALERALALFADADDWRRLQEIAMQQDFSWRSSARRYLGLYARLTGKALPDGAMRVTDAGEVGAASGQKKTSRQAESVSSADAPRQLH